MLSSQSTQPQEASTHRFLTKTPGRSVLKGRTGLQENSVQRNGFMTTNVRGKKVVHHSPQKSQQLDRREPQTSPSKAKPTIVTTHVPSRPLLDKTPFQNRVRNANTPFITPAPKLSLLDPQSAESTGSLRPSSMRKHIRIPRSASKSFETPVSKGNPYDVSDTSIEIADIVEKKQVVQEEDYDEIEYMAPSAIVPQYEPPFDMPVYRDVGQTILTLAHSYHLDDTPYPHFEIEADDCLLESGGFTSSPSKRDFIALPELEDDDPFKDSAICRKVGLSQCPTKPVKDTKRRVPPAYPPARKAPAPRSVPHTRASSLVTRSGTIRAGNTTQANSSRSVPGRLVGATQMTAAKVVGVTSSKRGVPNNSKSATASSRVVPATTTRTGITSERAVSATRSALSSTSSKTGTMMRNKTSKASLQGQAKNDTLVLVVPDADGAGEDFRFDA